MHGIVKEKYDGDLSKMLLFAFEQGYHALDGIYAKDIDAWSDFRQAVDELIENKDELPFRILAFDTVDVMGKMATDYVLRTQSRRDGQRYMAINDLAYGRGYELLEREVGDQIARLDRAGFSMFFLTHSKDRQFETREGLKYDKTTLSLGGRMRDLFLNMADFVVFVELGKEIEKGVAVDKRYIYFRGDSGLEAGSRFKHVPNRIEYSYKGFIDTVENAILKEYGGDEEAVSKAKEEQNKKREAEAEEYIDKVENAKSPEQLHSEILAIVTELDQGKKREAAEHFQELLGNADPRKSEDSVKLEEALKFVQEL